ncbi:hypothetical protein GGR57DRAFT_504765 [Xylariaceae sp. FL1272]|nr:hypothetical protein GGR57DRAFT_504765 [Xylariaceae sp. FL1272]
MNSDEDTGLGSPKVEPSPAREPLGPLPSDGSLSDSSQAEDYPDSNPDDDDYQHDDLSPETESSSDVEWEHCNEYDSEATAEFSHRSCKATPRWLIRGFADGSGGEYAPLLNGPHGIMPHAFCVHGNPHLKPTNIFNIGSLWREVEGHLTQKRDIDTHFSSWAVDPWVAYHFCAPWKRENPKLAVLDMTQLETTTPIRVYRAPDLHSFASNNRRTNRFHDEYLVYGPLPVGSELYIVDITKQIEAEFKKLSDMLSYTQPDLEALIAGMKQAKEIAHLLQDPRVKSPEFVIAMTTSLFMQNDWRDSPSPWLLAVDKNEDKVVEALEKLLHTEMHAIGVNRRRHPSQRYSLVNPHTWVPGWGTTRSVVSILGKLEARIGEPARCVSTRFKDKKSAQQEERSE